MRTPNINRLAAEGMRFTRYYSASPVCAPSRCTLLTGKHTGHATIRGNREIPGTRWHDPEGPEGQWPIPDEEITLAERLKELGYTTAVFGKWGLGGPGSTGHPNYQGFDHFYGYLCQRVAHNYYPTHLWRNHDVHILPGNTWFRSAQKLDAPLPSEQAYNERYRTVHYAPAKIADEMMRWLDQNDDKPFFLYYATIIPHLALQAPQEWVDKYPPDWDQEHYLGDRGYLPNARPHATYAAMISYLDDVIGRILQHLDEHGLTDNTIVLFSSDNGTSWVGGVDIEFFNSVGELRGHKAQLWEGGIRVPFIARWPGHIEPGSVNDTPAIACDIVPTLLDLVAGPSAPSDEPSSDQPVFDGVSLAPVLLGAETALKRPFLYWEYPEGPQWQAVLLDGRYKAVRNNLRKGDLTIQLFDLETDPGESTDIAADHPDLVERARQVMQREHTPSALFPIKVLDEQAGN
ncbi:MAG: N-acetylgalactosamine-6-sulfatase [Planctomycetota bacterium]|nr:MAG: N-acetylgalactosamine-6-sulfatase [Planctomycetota bacterium]